ncbi:hypothetical protein MT418_005361 [Batrachochytrium dendrobatidis]
MNGPIYHQSWHVQLVWPFNFYLNVPSDSIANKFATLVSIPIIMFGCIVAGRLVQTNLQQVDASKYAFELQDAASINHLVVFLIGTAPFPPGYAATVHFLWPSTANPVWTLLGHISNEKPSAIFKLGGKKSTTISKSMDTLMDDSDSSPFSNVSTIVAKLGISIEPIDQVMAQVSTLPSGSHSLSADLDTSMAVVSRGSIVGSFRPGDAETIANKLLENLYNYCCSFAGNMPMGGTSMFGLDWGTTFIPLKALHDWYLTTQRRIKADPTFLK